VTLSGGSRCHAVGAFVFLVGVAPTRISATLSALPARTEDHGEAAGEPNLGSEHEQSCAAEQPVRTGEAKTDRHGGNNHEDGNFYAAVVAAASTFLLFIVGAIVAWYQYKLMRGSLRATQEAAHATVRSAEAIERSLTHLERPFIHVRPNPPEAWVIDLQQSPAEVTFSWTVRNYGRTPAWIDGLNYGFEVEEHNFAALLDMPLRLIPDRPLSPGEEWKMRRQWLCDRVQHTDVTIGAKMLVFRGLFQYKDALGTSRIKRFCYIYSPPDAASDDVRGFWVACLAPEHNREE
jgi:hypothetical protein